MGVAKNQPGLKCCQSCKKSIAMLFPSSECECVGGKLSIKILILKDVQKIKHYFWMRQHLYKGSFQK